MRLFVLDTDHVTLYYTGHPIVVQKIDSRLPNELAITVLTVDEQLTGWYRLHVKPTGRTKSQGPIRASVKRSYA
jgi:hypothetical protein